MKIIVTSWKLISKNWGQRDPHVFRRNCWKTKYQVALRKEKFPEYSKNNENKNKMTVIFQGVDLTRMSNLNQP